MMSTYEYLHTVNNHEAIVEMFAKSVPDIYINIGARGHWKGKDAARRAWGTFIDMGPTPGMMPIHPITTPVIEVAGDGKTAKGMWIGTGFVAQKDQETGKPSCVWEWDKYAVDFIKEAGQWKFWHFHIHKIFYIGWDEKWSEVFTKEQKPMTMKYSDYNKPDGPSPDVNIYSINTLQNYIPAPPVPYETWDEKTSYGMPVK